MYSKKGFSNFIPYILWPIFLIFVFFDFKYESRLRDYTSIGSAYYVVPQDISPPIPELIENLFLKPIDNMGERDVVILIGNSTIGGAGSFKRNFLANKLSMYYDVINAGIGGQDFTTSAALAALAINRLSKRGFSKKIHIFSVYTPYRLYVQGDYWDWAPSIGSICEQEKFDGAFPACGGLPRLTQDAIQKAKWSNWILGNMRCIVNADFALRWIRQKSVWCDEMFTLEHRHPEFQNLRKKSESKFSEDFSNVKIDIPKVINFKSKERFFDTWEVQKDNVPHPFTSEVGFVSNQSWQDRSVEKIRTKLTEIDKQLQKNQIKFSLNFVLLTDQGQTMRKLLSFELIDRIHNGRLEFQEKLTKSIPNLRTVNLEPFNDDYYHDSSHLNELGQLSLVTFIRSAIDSL